MKKDIKNALKFLGSYLIVLILFALFVPAVLTLARENTASFLAGYSIILFLVLFAMVYSDAKKIASIEKKPASESRAYPLKGLVLGFYSFVPFIIIGLVYPLLRFDSNIYERIKHVALNTMLAPFYFILKAGNESAAAYVISFLAVPVIAAVGYYCGYMGYDFKWISRKKN